MRKMVGLLFVILVCSFSAAFAGEKEEVKQGVQYSSQSSCGQTINVVAQLSQKKRGCCSWHGGVCGCSNGRALCCDGSLSPSCGCRAEDLGTK